MTSWRLLRYVNVFQHHVIEQHPVYERDSQRTIDWTRLGERFTELLLSLLFWLLPLYVLLAALRSPLLAHLDFLLVVGVGLLLLAPSLAPWSLILGMLLGPAVAGERQRGTWVLLNLVPNGITPVLLAKLRAALWPLRYPLHIMRHLWLLMGFAIALGVMQSGVTALGLDGDRLMWFDQLCVPGASVTAARGLLLIGAMLVYLVDRIQQLLLMMLAALSVSATVHSGRMALIGGVAAALVVWLLETAGAALLVLQLPGQFIYTDINMLALLMLGPMGAYAIDLPFTSMALATALTMLLRELLIWGLWRWSLVAARRIT